MQRITQVAAIVLTAVLLATACGSGGSEAEVNAAPAFVEQGAGNIADEDISTTTEAPVDDAGSGASESQLPEFDVTEDTIPTDEEEDADGEFFDAVGVFMSCLDTEGYGFIGIPNGDDETAPVNQPGYGEALGQCAASSQIVTKMEAAEDTSNFTAEEIEEQNRNFTVFVDCLVGRGWTIPPLTPDENGSLQAAYIEIAQEWTPPDGGGLLDSGDLNIDDFTECGFTPDGDIES